jgi:hypothetical protein
MLAYTLRPHSTADTMDAKLLSSSTMSAASRAVAVPGGTGGGLGWGQRQSGYRVGMQVGVGGFMGGCIVC